MESWRGFTPDDFEMNQPLDPLNFRKNRYERPQQNWVCGRAEEGHACPLGPDLKGHCRATGECLPARKGERWICTRSEAQGGKCPEGPLPEGKCCHPIPPCQPVRSLRAQRGRLAWLLGALTLGVTLFVLTSSLLRKSWMSPGPLATVHATTTTQCSDCHTPEAPGVPVTLASFSLTRAIADSQRCLNCHVLGSHALNPHATAPDQLAAMGRKIQAGAGHPSASLVQRISSVLAVDHGRDSKLACATCHQEHQGRTFDLKQLSNSQCQVCHSVQFASFGQGHPEFGAYPYLRRTRIFFDHASHFDKHFVENKAKAPTSCQDCHVPDASGRLMLVKSFEQTCAACHAAQIQGEGLTTKGIAFFTVPGLDTETLGAKGYRLGGWPQMADGRLTPFMQMLLSRDPALKAALLTLHGVDLLDLSHASPAQCEAAVQLAWGVKGLLFDLAEKGQNSLIQELESAMKIGAPQAASNLVGELSRAEVVSAQKDWFPDLLTEVTNHRRGIDPPAPPPPPANPAPAKMPSSPPASGDDSLLTGGPAPATPAPKASAGDDSLLGNGGPPSVPAAPPPAPPAEAMPNEEDWVAAGGWYRPEGSYTLLYRPVGHADPFFTAWLTVSVAQIDAPQSAEAAKPVFQALSDPQAPGLCMKCHTVDRESGTLAVNWTAERPVPNFHPFTKFNHSAHFSLLTDTGCQACHRLNPQATYARYFTATDGSVSQSAVPFQSNFAPLPKAVCAQCHAPQVASDSCLECHNYHVGTFVTELKSPLSKLGSSPTGAGPP
jgi:hypothetical protein